MSARDLKCRMLLGNAAGMRISSARRLQREAPRRPKSRQGHQNEFRSTLEDKLLEKIVLIWTTPKTMKNTTPNQPRRGGYKVTPPEGPKDSRVAKLVLEHFGR